MAFEKVRPYLWVYPVNQWKIAWGQTSFLTNERTGRQAEGVQHNSDVLRAQLHIFQKQ